ncbi:hypothetical protein BDB00DRAFT_869291 [Zychaea mexicana]|uniref:uncharacterized protein n=1 Tax=Zychaea mexicana TaxID=64656 RepID=UPI0022FE9F45|nr:uncharacterized protein BDB00DRAFT_869291 [Zychaea mexicana]KAI9496712.1 hypothetical protein BDB00DRAFT_869291 [Zychaea mexicana]
MYAGHFALTTVLQRWFPNTSPYVLSFGVCFPDIVNGILSYHGIEGFTRNASSGLLGADLRCDYSHSLSGLIALSTVFAVVTNSGVPALVASLSHFVLDWLVHNSDLKLDPLFYDNQIIGGTGFWEAYPEMSYYFEGLLCVSCALYAKKDKLTISVNAMILALHIQFRLLTPSVLEQVLAIEDVEQRQKYVGMALTSSFVIPALLFGYLLSKSNASRSAEADRKTILDEAKAK